LRGGVNVASRLESIAPAGGVCVSKSVYDELSNQDDFDGIELGLQSLKGVGRLIEVLGLKGDKLNEPDPQKYQENKVAVHSDDEVPSIAIIPFDNKGADEDVFYAYGISTDLISDCSGAGLIRVAGLKDIEKLDYDNLKYEELSEKLLVRYIAQGTLWKMGDMFQLSIELYDTKDKKVVWSDRWQEQWDDLTTIKDNLSDGLLNALDTKQKVEKKIETDNLEAYEYYLKGKYEWEKRENKEDAEIARGFLKKAIKLDDSLLIAKNDIGWSYAVENNLEKAMEIFISTLKQGEKIGDNRELGNRGMGYVYRCKGEYDNALYYQNCSIDIDKKNGTIASLAGGHTDIAITYALMGNLDKALYHINCGFELFEELEDEMEVGLTNHQIGLNHFFRGDLDSACKYFILSLEILEKVDTSNWYIFCPMHDLGLYNYNKGNYDLAIEYLEKSVSIQRKIVFKGEGFLLWTTTFLLLSYKKINKNYDITIIRNLIEETIYIEDYINFALFKLLEDTTYLETAYNQVQEKADNLEPDVAAKFLSYPIPKAIVGEWEQIN
jgi:TolB-like protein